jgi:hypothetical protein
LQTLLNAHCFANDFECPLFCKQFWIPTVLQTILNIITLQKRG